MVSSATEAHVTIIVIAHSVRPELERCLGSIRRHADVPVETILVDNGSTDGTQEWVRSEHPEVTLIALETNIGEAARDHGLRRSVTPYTMFLDSDAALTPGALPALIGALDEHPDWGLVGPRLVYDDGTLQPSCRRFPPLGLPLLRRPPLARLFEDRRTIRRHLMADFSHDRPRAVLYLISACHLFRTSLARLAGPFNPRIPSGWAIGWADADWCMRIRDAGGEIVYFPGATVIHSYRRATTRQPVSGASLRQLRYFFDFQWKYRHRRRELIALSDELDRRSAA
jgi:N-acetylglucosaminyl-diphospho-decaprenol L-rhamnosyltransferase